MILFLKERENLERNCCYCVYYPALNIFRNTQVFKVGEYYLDIGSPDLAEERLSTREILCI